MKTLSIGTDNFADIIKDCYYVDKTDIISHILTNAKNTSLLFTRPRRFGKSLMISMLKYFFEKGHDDIYPYFKNLNISKHKNIIENYMGKYDVIYINLKGLQADNKTDIILRTKQLIIKEFLRYKELINKLEDEDIKLFNSYTDINLNDAIFQSSLKDLSYLIYKASGKRPILLIDEYDMPMQIDYEKNFYKDISIFYKGLFSDALKSNPYLEYAILTGVTRAGKMSLFSGLNNLLVDTVLDEDYASCFGFTDNDVIEMAKYYQANIDINLLNQWYGGYKFGGVNIYNPWSILNYFKHQNKFNQYWSSTTSSSILRSLIKNNYLDLSNDIDNLLNDKPIIHRVDVTINYEDLNITNDSIISSLLFMGYLTIFDTMNNISLLKFPNNEVKNIFIDELLVILSNGNLNLCYGLKTSFINGDIARFSSLLEEHILSSFTYFDFNNEREYQAMLLTLCSIIFDDCIIKSELPLGYGRCDILIYPKKSSFFAAVIEVKHLKNKTSRERLDKSAEKALLQILENQYLEEIKSADVKNIYAIGISFFKNKVISKIKIVK